MPGRIDRRCISQLTPRSRDHHVFLHAAGSLCKVCALSWLDRGADTSRGTPCEPSAFRWAEEAHGDDKLLSMLRATAAVKRLLLQFRYWRLSAPRLGATTAYLFLTSGVASAALSGDLERLKDIGHLRVRRLLHFYSASLRGRG